MRKKRCSARGIGRLGREDSWTQDGRLLQSLAQEGANAPLTRLLRQPSKNGPHPVLEEEAQGATGS
jgi:hypothetical protein